MPDQRKGVLAEFKDFVLRGNVVDLAIAVVIGTAFADLVKQFVADMITPLVSIFSKHTNFADLAFHVRGARFAYGAFLNSVITFVILAAVVFFFVVKPINFMLERRRRGGEAEPETLSDEAALLTQIRDLLAARTS
jgi:large conductance mechanosensitive channel